MVLLTITRPKSKSFNNMTPTEKISLITIFGIILHTCFPIVCFAYIDPGTGTYLFQMLLGLLLGSIFALKMAWKSIKIRMSQFFSGDHSKKHEDI